MAIAHTRMKALSRSNGSTVRMMAYRAGIELVCDTTGEVFNYTHKIVQGVELLLPKDAPAWAVDLQKLIAENRQMGVQRFSDLAESFENRKDSQPYREYEFALPRELTAEQCKDLARDFIQDQMCGLGITVLANFHLDEDPETGDAKYHCHAVMLTRYLQENGLSPIKERAWEKREFAKTLREHFAAYTNFHLAKHGHSARIDPRTYAEQGIDLEPQSKLGYSVLKQEAALGNHPKQLDSPTVTDKGKQFQRIKLRNLYGLLSDPQQIFSLVTKPQATFMWGDVEKTLRRYVDDPVLFKHMVARLKTSQELVEIGKVVTDKETRKTEAVFTTQSMLAHETSLVTHLRTLAARESHPVEKDLVQQATQKLHQKLEAHGGLSEDQQQALQHMLGSSQVSCIVGYAGSGKTTLVRGAQEAWEQAGYTVYGLAPTGKASENLRTTGIQSQVLHKFLWQYDQGRCQYNSQSVLILDEAGMVDVPRFDRLLKAVDHLGVKLVIMGDGGQLQAIEAGDAFRMVTSCLSVATLETIVRQEKPWQREATYLFGRQRTKEALKLYKDHGHFTFVHEKPIALDLLRTLAPRDLIETYNQARRVAGTIYQFIQEDLKQKYPHEEDVSRHFRNHQDYPLHKTWHLRRLSCVTAILSTFKSCHPLLKEMGVDPTSFARDALKVFPGMFLNKDIPSVIKNLGLEAPLEDFSPICELRSETKDALIEAWIQSSQDHPHKSHIILTYTNKDSKDLNQRARAYRRDQGLLQGKDHVFSIHTETRDAFDTITLTREKRSFALGDRLIFLKNCDTIKNGMLGTITHIQDTAITLILDDTQQEFTFNPRVYRYFDHGYAPTIHKAQGVNVDFTFVLATFQMFKNLIYVAMTRHHKNVKIFVSYLDFWREGVLDVMAKSNHKLLAFDYISEQTAEKLLQQDENLLDKTFRRLDERIHGLKAVSQESWNRVVESFMGKDPRGVYGALPLAFTENTRAQILLDQKWLTAYHSQKDLHYYRVEDVQKALTAQQTKRLFRDHRPLQNQPAFRKQDNIRRFGPLRDLIMDLQKGRWYNPRDGQKGNLFHYIADSKRCSYSEALAWVGEWAQAPVSVYKRGAKQALYLRQAQEQPLAQKTFQVEDQSQRIPVTDTFKIPQENPSQNLQPFSPPKRPHHQAPSYQLKDVERALSPQHIEQLFTENIGPWVNQPIARKSGSTLRFGDSGGFAVNLKKGLWFSHYDDQKGNLFHFIARSKGCSYKEAITWVGEWVQTPQSTSLRNEQPQRLQKAREAQDQENQERILKGQQMAEKAWATSLPLTHTLAERYLRETRSIQTAPLDKIQGEGDLRFAPQSYTEGRSVPALLAFGRTPQGKLICYQAIYLDAHTATKASGLQVPKRTHGVLKGAVVTIQKDLHHKGITFVAEGIETALSLKEAGLPGEILATLGQSNMAHVTTTNPYIVLCGDYDGKNQDRTRGNLEKIQATLKSKGHTVHTLWPATTGLQKIDFNDMLKTDGIQKIHDLFKGLPHDFKTPQENPNQDLQTSPSQGNPQDQTQRSPSEREQSLSKNQVQKAKDPIAPETEIDKDRKALLKDVEKTTPLREKTPSSSGQKEHKQSHGTLGTVTIQKDVLQKIFSLQNTMNLEPDIAKRQATSHTVETLIEILNPTSVAAMINRNHNQGQEKVLREVLHFQKKRVLEENPFKKDEFYNRIENLMDKMDTCTLKRLAALNHEQMQQETLNKIHAVSVEIRYEDRAPQKNALYEQIDSLIDQLDRAHLSKLAHEQDFKKETPLTKIEHLTSALDFVRDATRRKGMVQDLEKTISTLDIKSRQILETNLQTMEKIQRHTPHLIRSDSMTMEL